MSEYAHSNPWDIVLSSQTSADITAMTGGGLVVLYPEWTMNHVALKNQGATHRSQDDGMGAMIDSEFHLEQTTDFLATPCKGRCPAHWRKLGEDRK